MSYWDLFLEVNPSTTGIPVTYDIIIILSRHVESIILMPSDSWGYMKSKWLSLVDKMIG